MPFSEPKGKLSGQQASVAGKKGMKCCTGLAEVWGCFQLEIYYSIRGERKQTFFLAENDDFANCFVIKINSEIEANRNVYSCIHLSKELFLQRYLHSILPVMSHQTWQVLLVCAGGKLHLAGR